MARKGSRALEPSPMKKRVPSYGSNKLQSRIHFETALVSIMLRSRIHFQTTVVSILEKRTAVSLSILLVDETSVVSN